MDTGREVTALFGLYKPFVSPFAGTPAAHKDDAADILVEGEADPHTDKAVAEGDADDVTHADGNRPVEDDGHDDGIDGIARGSQGADGEDVGCASDLEEPVDDKYPHAHRDDLLIVGEGAEKALAGYARMAEPVRVMIIDQRKK